MSLLRKTSGKESVFSKRKLCSHNEGEGEEQLICAENNSTHGETDIKKPVFTRAMLYFLTKGKKIYEYECSENNIIKHGRHYPENACGICGRSLNPNTKEEFCDTLGNSFFCCSYCRGDYKNVMCLKSYYPLESKYIFANKFTAQSLKLLKNEISGKSFIKTIGISSSAFMPDEEVWFYDRFALLPYCPTPFSAFWDAFNKAVDEIELRENMNVKFCSNDEKLCLILKYGQKSLKEDDAFQSNSFLCACYSCDEVNDSAEWKRLLDTDYKFCAFFYLAFPIQFEKAFIDFAKQYFDVKKYFDDEPLPVDNCITDELQRCIKLKLSYGFLLRIDDKDAANELLELNYYTQKHDAWVWKVALVQWPFDNSLDKPVPKHSSYDEYCTYYNYVTKTIWADYCYEYPGSVDDAATYLYRGQHEVKD